MSDALVFWSADPVIRLWDEMPHEPPATSAPLRERREKARR